MHWDASTAASAKKRLSCATRQPEGSPSGGGSAAAAAAPAALSPVIGWEELVALLLAPAELVVAPLAAGPAAADALRKYSSRSFIGLASLHEGFATAFRMGLMHPAHGAMQEASQSMHSSQSKRKP